MNRIKLWLENRMNYLDSEIDKLHQQLRHREEEMKIMKEIHRKTQK